MVKRLTLGILICVWLSRSAVADDPKPQHSASAVAKWGLEFKLGRFYPDIEEWPVYYGNDDGFSGSLTLSRRLGSVFEIVTDAAHFHDRGAGYYPANDRPGGQMLYELYTLAAGINIRTPRPLWNWLTPYVGISASRAYYHELINGGDRRRGYRDGGLVRAGVRVLLDGLEPSAAASLNSGFGIVDSSLIIEWQQLDTDEVSDYNLGGRSVYGGLRFDF